MNARHACDLFNEINVLTLHVIFGGDVYAKKYNSISQCKPFLVQFWQMFTIELTETNKKVKHSFIACKKLINGDALSEIEMVSLHLCVMPLTMRFGVDLIKFSLTGGDTCAPCGFDGVLEFYRFELSTNSQLHPHYYCIPNTWWPFLPCGAKQSLWKTGVMRHEDKKVIFQHVYAPSSFILTSF